MASPAPMDASARERPRHAATEVRYLTEHQGPAAATLYGGPGTLAIQAVCGASIEVTLPVLAAAHADRPPTCGNCARRRDPAVTGAATANASAVMTALRRAADWFRPWMDREGDPDLGRALARLDSRARARRQPGQEGGPDIWPVGGGPAPGTIYFDERTRAFLVRSEDGETWLPLASAHGGNVAPGPGTDVEGSE